MSKYAIIFGICGLILSGLLLQISSLKSTIKDQNAQIAELIEQQVLWTNTNDVLASRIKSQNEELRLSSLRQEDIQNRLFYVAGKNKSLSREYQALREKLKSSPVPTNNEDAILELKTTMKTLTTKWNGETK